MIPRSLAIAAAALLITGCATQQQPETLDMPITFPYSTSDDYNAANESSKEALVKAKRDADAIEAKDEAEALKASEAEAKDEKRKAAARRRAAEREAKAAEAAVEKAKAEEAKADQDFDDAHPIGARCESTLGRFETDVLSSLSRTQKAIVLSSRCSSQHKILQAVGILPPERRIEAFDRLLDSAAR
jgi:hypothetical protein